MDADRDDSNRIEPPGTSAGSLEEAASDGVLGSLPRTRPQRVSPRRAASQAKRTKTKRTSAKPARATARRKASGPPGTAKRKPAPRSPARPAAPKQGYEPEEELKLGRTIHPPGAAELVESVADIFLELASASLKSGGRVLKDALSPLRRS